MDEIIFNSVEEYDSAVKGEILDFFTYMASKGIILREENGLIEFPDGNIQEHIDEFLSMGAG